MGYQRSLLAIGARLVERNAIFRRARELQLPPDWGAVGLCATRKVGNLLNVGVRELGVWYVVPDFFFGDGEDCSRIEIIFKISKDRARLRDAMSPAQRDENCRNVFSCKLMATDAGSLPRPSKTWT